MKLKPSTKKDLDKFGPYGSGIGTVIGAVSIEILGITGAPSYLKYLMLFFTPFLAYTCCTCVHRKYKSYCHSALGGAIGSIIGMYIGGWPAYFVALTTLGLFPPSVYLVWIICTGLPPFLLSRHICKRAQRKEAHAQK